MEEENKQLSKHEIKMLKREERDKEREASERIKSRARLIKNLVKYGSISLVIVAVIAGIFVIGKNDVDGSAVKEGPYTAGVVHWHASLQVFACGIFKEMPAPFGDAHLGSPLLHTHSDRLVHIEGKIWRKEDIMLGKYMDNIGVDFAQDRILDYVNGNECNDGKENKVRMEVNGKENFEFRNYIINDGDKIEIRYE